LVDLDGGEDKAFTQIKLPLQRPFYHLALIKIQTPANVAEETLEEPDWIGLYPFQAAASFFGPAMR